METGSDTPSLKVVLPAMLVSILLFTGVSAAYQSAKSRPSSIVLPGGITYLGQTPTSISPSSLISPSTPSLASYKGKLFPYSFRYPAGFSLGWFPNDPFDAVTAFITGTDANQNIFFRVEKLSGTPIDYARSWWKQYNWKGVTSVTTFSNSNNLTGYRAKYLDQTGKTPYDHVFFEIPGKKDLIIWISGKLFSPKEFDTLVDSVNWK